MNKCDVCGKETNFVQFQELGIEIQDTKHCVGIGYKDVILPEGTRLPCISEIQTKSTIWQFPIYLQPARGRTDNDLSYVAYGRNRNGPIGIQLVREIK